MVRMPVSRLAHLVAALLVLLVPALASAAAGDLDATFNPGGTTPSPGVATFDVGGSGADEDANAVVILPNGRIVVAAATSNLCVLLGLTPAGALDSGFGTDGKVVLSNCARALALQPDGAGGAKIIVVSFGEVRRFNANGTLDTTFGASGVATAPVGGPVVIQSDRKIVLTGGILVRLEPDGALDSAFGVNGVAAHDFGFEVGIGAVAVQTDGHIVVGGLVFDPPGPVFFAAPHRFFVARFSSLGALDTDFHFPDGYVLTDFDGEQLRALAVPALDPANKFAVLQSGVTGLVIQGGKIVAVGGTQANVDDGDAAHPGVFLSSHRDFVLMARYGSNGQLDPTFGNTIDLATMDPALDGRAYGPLGYAEGVAVQADGKIVTSGFFHDAVVPEAGLFGVARFTTEGVLDSTFGAGGIAATDFTPGASVPPTPDPDPAADFASAPALAIQENGKIVAVGAAALTQLQDPQHQSALPRDTRVVRYRGDSDEDNDGGDTEPPHIISAKVTPSVLWPPLRQMVPVTVTVNATDDSGVAPTCAITQIQSDQPVGRISPDWVITGPLTARLRAEISLLMGLRRNYTLTVGCQDAAGNTATTQVHVIVTLLPPGLFGLFGF